MRLVDSKAISGCVIFLVTLICGVTPYLLFLGVRGGSARHGNRAVSRLNSLQAFASGIFIATCLLHLLPEAREAIADSLSSDLPVSEMIVSFGFLLLLVVENVLLSCHERQREQGSSSSSSSPAGGGRHQASTTVVVYTKESSRRKKRVHHHTHRKSSEHSSTASLKYGTTATSDGRIRNGVLPSIEDSDGFITPFEGDTDGFVTPIPGPEDPLRHDDVDNENQPLLHSTDIDEVVIAPQRRAIQSEGEQGDNTKKHHNHNRTTRKHRSNSTASKNDSSEPKETASSLEDEKRRAVLKSFVLLFALSLHTVFDGLVVGLQKNLRDVWTLLAAVTLHKGLVSVSIALSLVESHRDHPRPSLVYLVFFSLVAPVGLVVGIVLTESNFDKHAQTMTSGILQSVATGTFMYVTFVESLKGRFDAGNRLLNVLFVLLGFGCVCVLKVLMPD